MIKKITGILICLIFLLTMSNVMAEDNLETNSSQYLEDIPSLYEHNTINTENETDLNDTIEYFTTDDREPRNSNSKLNTTGVVMSDDDYSCGAASFATVLNNFGKNITLNEARIITNTTLNGTTMQGIIEATKKFDLIGYGVQLESNQLKENYIVHMDIIGVNHWSVVRQITDNFIILADPNLGNYKYPLIEFKQYYTNQTIIILNNTKINSSQSIILSDNLNFISEIGQKIISGKGYAVCRTGYLFYIKDKPKGFAIKYTIIVPKWGSKVVKISTTKLTKHKLSTRITYIIKVYSKPNYKGKVETIYQAAFFNFAHKAGSTYNVNRPTSFPIQSIKVSYDAAPFPYKK